MDQIMDQIKMGIGKLADPGFVFARKFRFTISGDHFPEYCVHSASIDYLKKTIKLSCYEVWKNGEIPIHNWTDAMLRGDYPNQQLKLAVYDGCGTELYYVYFSGLKITGRTNDFNYESNDVSLHNLEISYNQAISGLPERQSDLND